MEKEKALAKVILLSIRLTKEANSRRGESKKTSSEYVKALATLCDMMDIDPEVVDNIVEPKS